MEVSYMKLWHRMLNMGMSKKELADRADISKSTLVRMKNNKMISLATLIRISHIMDCEIEDIVDYENERGE